jgi:hypothetical protein
MGSTNRDSFLRPLKNKGFNTHGGELCIIFRTIFCGEHVNPNFADACPREMMQDLPTHVYTYCISDVIYSLVSSYGYNGHQIGQRVAQELAGHGASHGGPATRTKRRPEPHAQPVAYVRQRSGRWSLLTPRGCTTPAPRSDGGPPCGCTWEEQRHHRSLVPRDAMPTRRSSFRLLVMASPYWMIYVRY